MPLIHLFLMLHTSKIISKKLLQAVIVSLRRKQIVDQVINNAKIFLTSLQNSKQLHGMSKR